MAISLEDIQGAQQASQQATAKATELQAGGFTIGDQLKQRVEEAYDYNRDITSKLDTASSDYLSAPATGREKYQDIFNPFQREALVSQYVGNQSLPMLMYSDILGHRQGRIGDLVGAGTNAYNAETARALGLAGQAGTDLTNLMDLYKLQQERADAERQYQLDLMKASSSGSSVFDLFKDILPFANATKLNEGEFEKLNNATTTLESIGRLENYMMSDKDSFKRASRSGAFGNLARLTDPTSRTIRSDIVNLQDLLARSRSGAALNENELKLYNQFIAGDPLSVVFGYQEGPEAALRILKGIAEKDMRYYGQREQSYNYFNDIINQGLGVPQYQVPTYGNNISGTGGTSTRPSLDSYEESY